MMNTIHPPKLKAHANMLSSASAARRAARRSLIATLLMASLVVSVVVGINVGVDTYDYFGRQDERADLQAYLTGLREAENGVRFSYNDRPVKLALARQDKSNCIIVGSSHVMTYRVDRHPLIQQDCDGLQNVGVSGASFEDVTAMLGAAYENDAIKHIFLGVDLWSFKRNTRNQWYHISDAVFAGRRDFGLDPSIYAALKGESFREKIAEAFSFKYLKQNWTALKRAARGKAPISYDARPLSADGLKDELALRADGSLSYPAEFKKSPTDSEIQISDQWTDPPYVDPAVVAEMRQILTRLQEKGKKITIIISPYHPVVLQCTKPDICKSMAVVDPLIRGLARDLGIPVIGGFDPQDFPVTRDSYIDFQHLRGSELFKLTILNK